MLVAFASLTGNVRNFVSKLDFPTFDITRNKGIGDINEPFVLITYTTGKGLVPREVTKFLENNSSNLKAVIGSGNKIWGNAFCGGAKTVSAQHNVPLLHTFEVRGYSSDLEIVTQMINELEGKS